MKKYFIIGFSAFIIAAGIYAIFGEKTMPDNSLKPAEPAYKGQEITFLGDDPIINQIPKDVVAKQRKLLADLAASLAQNPLNFDGWMTIGSIKKFYNNYLGARDAWEYAKMASVNDPLPYLNLGHLYGYYLKDLKKAEANFLAAVDRDPSEQARYEIAIFYRDFGFKDKALKYFKEVLELQPGNEAVEAEIERLENSK